MYRLASLGDKESICGFSSIGIDTFYCYDEKSAVKLLKELSEDGYAVIFITEELAAKIENEIEKYNNKIVPAIILIPGVKGNTGKGMSSVLQSIERAVGSQLPD